MASRKDSKEQARADRLAREQAEAAKAVKTRRFLIFGGVIAVAVIAVVAVVVISSSGGSAAKSIATNVQKGNTNNASIKKIDAAVTAELKGIPQSGTTLGKSSAKVTMVYYGDLQCPICADFTLGKDGGGLPDFISNQVKSGEANIVYKSFCTATCSSSNPAPGGGNAAFSNQQTAAYAAGKQNKFWNFAETFYREQSTEDSGYVTASYIDGLAKQVPGLNLVKWTTDRSDKALKTQVVDDETLAAKIGLEGTPSLIMKGPKGTELVNNGSFATYAELEAAYKAVS